MAVAVRNRYTSNSSSHRSAASIATKLSAKVNTKVRSLVSKFEFLGKNNYGASNLRDQPQRRRSKQRRSTIASIRQTLGHDRAPASKTSLEVDEGEDEDFPMRPDVTHVFSNADIGRSKKSVVKRCASMFDRLAKDRAIAFEGRLSQIHTFAPYTKQKSPQLLKEPEAITKGKGAMIGGVKALIKVFNRRPLSTDVKPIANWPKSARPRSDANMCGDPDLEMFDRNSFNDTRSLVSVRDDFCVISRFSSTSPLAERRSENLGHSLNESQRHSAHLRQADFADLGEISLSHEGHTLAATLSDSDTLSSPTIPLDTDTDGEPNPVAPLPKPKGPLANRLLVSALTQSFTPMLYRVRCNHSLTLIENQNKQDAIAPCTSCRSFRCQPCPCTGPSSQASRPASTSTSSCELPALQTRRSSLGDSSTSSSESAPTPQGELELRRKGTPLPEGYLATRRESMERFRVAMSAPRRGFPNGYWDLALRIVTEGDDDFYDDSSDEEESEEGKEVPQHKQGGYSDVSSFHSGIRKALRKQSDRVNSQDSGLCERVYVSEAISSCCSLEPLSQVVSSPSSYGYGYGSNIYDSEYYSLSRSSPDRYSGLPGNSDLESADMCRDMPLGEIIQLLGRSVSLDQNVAPKRIRIPVHGMPPTKVLSPKPDMYHNTTKDIRHLIFRWS